MITRHLSAYALALVAILSVGCTAVGNVLFTPHPASLRDIEPELAIERCGRIGAAAAVGVGVAALQTLLEREAEQYRATYSASASEDIATHRCLKLRDELASLDLRLASPGDEPAYRAVDGAFAPKGTKAKVSSLPWRTLARKQNPFASESWSSRVGNAFGFINPLMYLHFLWGLVDDDIYHLDFAVRARVETILPKTRKPQSSELTIPVGKIHIDEIAAGTARVEGLGSGYVPGPTGKPLLSNVTVTVVEANDLGDVVGKAAGLVGEHKQDITDRLSGFLGLQ